MARRSENNVTVQSSSSNIWFKNFPRRVISGNTFFMGYPWEEQHGTADD